MDTNLKNKEFSFIISGRPCSKKNSRRVFSHYRTGKVVNVPSEAYERFKVDAKWQIQNIKVDDLGMIDFPLSNDLEVTTTFHAKGDLQFDGDNAHTGILDILQDSGIIVNDKQVRKGHYEIIPGYKEWETVINIKSL